MHRELQFGFLACLAVVVASALATPERATAATIYGDIVGNAAGSGYGTGIGVNHAVADGFTMTQSYNLASVDLVLSEFTAQAGSNLALSIYSDNGGSPGTDLYDLSTNVVGTSSGTPATANFSGSGSFLLTAGTTYWLDLYATNTASSTGNSLNWVGEFNGGSPATPAGVGATEVGQERTVFGSNPPPGPPDITDLRTGFQLNGTAVPEPSSISLAALAGLLIVVRGFRRPKVSSAHR